MANIREETTQGLQQDICENRICSAVGQELVKHYPGWKWWVECKLRSGMVSVRNLSLDGDYGFYIPINKFTSDISTVMRAGGEILERYNMERAKRKTNGTEIKRDFTGAAKGERDAVS